MFTQLNAQTREALINALSPPNSAPKARHTVGFLLSVAGAQAKTAEQCQALAQAEPLFLRPYCDRLIFGSAWGA